MKSIRIANIISKLWYYLILMIGGVSVLAGSVKDETQYIISWVSKILLLIIFYKLIQLLFKPLNKNKQLFENYLNGKNIDKYSKNKTWVMICTVLITVIFILPTLGLILSLTITQFISLSKQKNIIV